MLGIDTRVMINGNVYPQFRENRFGIREFLSRVTVKDRCVFAGDAVIDRKRGLLPCPGLSTKEAGGQTRITIVSGDLPWPASKPVSVILHEEEGDRQFAVQQKERQLFVMIQGGLKTPRRPVITETSHEVGLVSMPRITYVLRDGTKVEAALPPW